jgi:putative ABC transport system permease protein
MSALWQDLRFAVRSFAKQPGFTGLAVLILALGIGTTTAVFSVVNAVLLRPLPYVDPSRLVALTSVFRPNSENRPSRVVVLKDVERWRPQSKTIASMGAFAYTQLPIRVGQQAFSSVTALMDPEFLPTLGNPLAMGTFFTPGNGAADPSAILSHRLWLDAFSADPAVVGKAVIVDGAAFTVRGVLRADFQFPRADASYFKKPVDLLLPSSSFLGFQPTSRQWFGIARLAPGVSLERAQAEMQGVATTLPDGTASDWSVRLTPLAEETTRSSRQSLLIVFGIAIVLLLIASANFMNLLFSRGAARAREMTIRKAMGSSVGRLVRQLLTESLLLSALGAAAGVAIAMFGIKGLTAMSPVYLPVTAGIGIDGTVLSFTLAIGVASALVAGLFPALHVSSANEAAVRAPGARVTTGHALARVQRGLCVAQMALGVALLACAGLLAHSLWRLNNVDPGFETDRILGFNLSLPSEDVPTAAALMERRRRFYQDALDAVRTTPGVVSAGWISFLPPETRAGVFMGLAIEGAPAPGQNDPPRTTNTLISSPAYFSTMGMRIVKGRDLSDLDTAANTPVIVVNETLARRYFPGQEALGRKIGTGFDGLRPVREIVGIVADAHDRGLARAPVPTAYIPFTQFALPYGSIAFKTGASSGDMIPEIRSRLAKLNPGVPLTDFQTIDRRLAESLDEPRFYTLMATVCAGLATLFVTLGLYGIIAHSVSRRIPEFGVRMAIGADGVTIRRMVIAQAMRMAVAGVALGGVLSIGLTRTLRTLLFELDPFDPVSLAGSVVVVVLVTACASYVPALRASRVDPLVALRHD